MKNTRILPDDFDDKGIDGNARGNLGGAFMSGATRQSTSATMWGLALMAVAIVLGFTRWFPGIGRGWSLLMLAGGAWLWQSETGKARVALWFPPFFAALVVAQTFRIADIGIAPALWMCAAFLVARDAWKRATNAQDGWARGVQLAQMKRGYRVYIALGVALCWLSLGQTWGRTEGTMSFGWRGGMASTLTSVPTLGADGYYSYQLQTQLQYQPMMYPNNWFWPGFEYSGRNQPLVIWTMLALLFVAGWASLRRDDALFLRGAAWANGALLFTGLWWLWRQNTEPGPRWFFVGLLMTCFGVWKLRQGEESGAHDAASLLQKLKTLKRK